MPQGPLFSDSTGIRDSKFLLRLTKNERDFLKEQAHLLGVRDVATLVRRCIRKQLIKR